MRVLKLSMKSVAVIIACFAVTAVFTSCKKDGVYNPSKKISKIYTQKSGAAKELEAIYKWDGNKLDRITSPDGSYFTKFSYDGNRVSKITDSDGDWTYSFSYNGSKFEKVERTSKYYSTVYKPTYKGSNIEKLEVTRTYLQGGDDDADYYSSSKANESIARIALELFVPFLKEDRNVTHKSRKAGNVEIWTYTYTWKGGNIIKEVYESTSSDNKVYTTTTEYKEYDNKKNPFYGFVGVGDYVSSKNNCKKEEQTDNGGRITEIEYEYIYSGSYPTECIETESSGSSKTRSTTLIEYE